MGFFEKFKWIQSEDIVPDPRISFGTEKAAFDSNNEGQLGKLKEVEKELKEVEKEKEVVAVLAAWKARG